MDNIVINVTEVPDNIDVNITEDSDDIEVNTIEVPDDIQVNIATSLTAIWGMITGTLSDQEDLQAALNERTLPNFVIANDGSLTLTRTGGFTFK